MWEYLRERRLDGHRFRRQAVILGWIADFYCPGNNLVVELDGAPHLQPGQQRKDAHRDRTMSAHGFRVLRIQSRRVFTDLQAVLDEIRAALPTLPKLRIAGELGAHGRRAGTRKDRPATEAATSRAS